MWWLIVAGPPTYVFRVCGLLLARTRLVPRQLASELGLASIAVLAALVAPSVLLPQGRLMLDPLTNPRLLVVLLLAPLLWFVRRHEPVVLLGAPVGGLALLSLLGQFSHFTFTLSLPLSLLLFAGASLVLLVGRQVGRRHFPQGSAHPAGAASCAGTVRVMPAETQRLPARAVSRPARRSVVAHTYCVGCWCSLPIWANYCGWCGLLQPLPGGSAKSATLPLPHQKGVSTALAAPRRVAALDFAPTRPLAAVTVRPRRRASAFWLFWTGETISNLGSSFTLFALPLLVFRLSGSALSLGLASVAEMLPYLLFGLLIGAWVDRLNRKRLMIVIDLCQALVLSSIPVAFFFGVLTVWWIYAVSFVSASLKFAFETGQFAAIPSLVEPEKRVAATGRLQAGVSGSQMLGPILAGALLFLLPLPTLLFINAATFLVSACTLLCIRRSFNASEPREPTSLRQAMIEGLRYVFGHPLLRAISIMAPLCNLLTISLVTQLPLFASVTFHATGWQLSLFYTAAGAGLTVFAALAGRLRRRLPFSKAVLGAFLFYGLLTMSLAIFPWYWLAVVLWGLMQGSEMIFNVNTAALRMDLVPNHLLGRVRSIAFSIAYSVQPVGALLGGLLIARVDKGQVTLVYAGIGLVVFLIALSFCFTALGHAERYLPGGISEPARGAAHSPAVTSRRVVGEATGKAERMPCPDGLAPRPEREAFVLTQAVEHGPVPMLVGVEGGSHDGDN